MFLKKAIVIEKIIDLKLLNFGCILYKIVCRKIQPNRKSKKTQ